MKLIKKKNITGINEPLLLVILDGVGATDRGASEGNAIAAANIPVLKGLWSGSPTIRIQAHGKAVGMPSDDDMGNSEVGHNVLGCGRVFDQGAKLVSNSIDSGELFAGEAWNWVLEPLKGSSDRTLHLIGLLSDGNVHSHIDHLKALIAGAKKSGVKRVRVHALLDGRDVPEKSALEYTEPFEAFLKELRSSEFDVKIASGGGRMTVTMDRYDADWSMVERGWKFHVLGEGRAFSSIKEAIQTFREEDPKVIDQYLPGFVISENGKPVGTIHDGDSVVFFNFRGDRAIEISKAFTEKNFKPFDRKRTPDVRYAGMMQYDGDLKLPEKYLVSPPAIDRTLGEYMASEKITQYAISETQKFGHVTFFWNGNRSGYIDKTTETYVEIPSDVIPFDQKPDMKAPEITDTLLTALDGRNKFLRVNFANGDMVGHTGNFDATVRAMETLDKCIKRLKDAADRLGAVMLITADHGNADEMYQLDKKGGVQVQNSRPVPKTSHTLNPVNLCLYDPKQRFSLKTNSASAGLGNMASTVLDILGYEAPEDYLESLLIRKGN